MSGIFRLAYAISGLPSLLQGMDRKSDQFGWIPDLASPVHLVAIYDSDQFGTAFPEFTRIAFEVASESIDGAAHTGDSVAEVIARLMFFLAGGAYKRPRLLAALDVTPGLMERRYKQWLYDSVEAKPTRQLQVPDIDTVAHSLAKRGERPAEAIVRAMKWYTDAVLEIEPTDRFLKAWVGLEAIGPLLNRRAHKSGWRDCRKCVGEWEKRGADDRSERGIRHLLSVKYPDEPLFDVLKVARNKLMHGEWPLIRVRQRIEPHVENLIKALVSGILTCSAPAGVRAGSRQAFEPVLPDERGADMELSAVLRSADPNAFGPMKDYLTVVVDLEGSHLDEAGYQGNVGVRVIAELPCELRDFELKSLRTPESGLEFTTPTKPEITVQRIKRDSKGRVLSRSEPEEVKQS